MSTESYTYVIVGAGLAGASAVAGIRELDRNGSVLLIGRESHLPYHRPDLSKKLWFGKKQVADIFVHDQAFYQQHGVTLALGTEVVALDVSRRMVTDSSGRQHHYQKLLLATGGVPRSLPIPGGDLEGICYYRYLDDYLRIRSEAQEGRSALVVGGGFIGSELAAALSINKLEVTIILPSPYLCRRVFPESLGRAIQAKYEERGIEVLTGDTPASFTKSGSRFLTRTKNGREIASDLVVVGVGLVSVVKLAQDAGLQTGDGIVVNEYLQTSHPEVYAAGDNAFFPCRALAQPMRIEHWDNALNQGKWAGRNMAGAPEPFTYLPYFFSDLFEFGYEAVGEVSTELATFADWQRENETGVIYYLRGDRLRGAMMCNFWDKVDAARELIKQGERVTPDGLRGAIG